MINIENLPVLSDSISTFGSPTSDSERDMITEDTKQIIMCIYSFSGKDEIEDYLNEIQELLKIYANATNIEIAIVE